MALAELLLVASIATGTPVPQTLLDFTKPKTQEDAQANRRIYRHVASIVHDEGAPALNKDPFCYVRQFPFKRVGTVYVLFNYGESHQRQDTRVELGSSELDKQHSFLIRHYSVLKKDFLLATFQPFDNVFITFADVGCQGAMEVWQKDVYAGNKEPMLLPGDAAEAFSSKYNFDAFLMTMKYAQKYPLPKEYSL